MDGAARHRRVFRLIPACLLLIAACAGSIPLHAMTVWSFQSDLATNSKKQDHDTGKQLVFSRGGRLLTATGWVEQGRRRSGRDSGKKQREERGKHADKKGERMAFSPAPLGRFMPGLGICDRRESGKCRSSGSRQPIDGTDGREWVLFVLDGFYSFESIGVDPFSTESRTLSYWVGNVDPGLQLKDAAYVDLAALGFQRRVDTVVPIGADTLLLPGNLQGNALLIGSGWPGHGEAMYLTTLGAAPVPLPAALWLFGSACAAVAWVRWRHRRMAAVFRPERPIFD